MLEWLRPTASKTPRGRCRQKNGGGFGVSVSKHASQAKTCLNARHPLGPFECTGPVFVLGPQVSPAQRGSSFHQQPLPTQRCPPFRYRLTRCGLRSAAPPVLGAMPNGFDELGPGPIRLTSRHPLSGCARSGTGLQRADPGRRRYFPDQVCRFFAKSVVFQTKFVVSLVKSGIFQIKSAISLASPWLSRSSSSRS